MSKNTWKPQYKHYISQYEPQKRHFCPNCKDRIKCRICVWNLPPLKTKDRIDE